MDAGGLKEAQVQSHSSGGANMHNFNRIRQVARQCALMGATWRLRLNRLSVAATRPSVKLSILYVLDLSVTVLHK